MGWREQIETWLEQQIEDDDGVGISPEFARRVVEAQLCLPAPDRIALARELLAGSGWSATRDAPARPQQPPRAAMMGEG